MSELALASPPSARRPALAGVVVLALVAGLVSAFWPRTTVVEVFRQPADVTYRDGRQHVAVLRHVRAPIAALRLSRDSAVDADHYDLVLGSDPGGNYGHHVRLDAGTGDGVDGLAVRWTETGATLTYGSGHVLTVPARLFVGGR